MAVNSCQHGYCRNSGKGVVCSFDHLAQVDPDTRLSAKEILEAKWFTEDVNTVNYTLEVGRQGNPSSELMQSFLLQVMGVRELDTTSLEGTMDQDRDDSGENLNIAPTTVYLISGVSICPENLISSQLQACISSQVNFSCPPN